MDACLCGLALIIGHLGCGLPILGAQALVIFVAYVECLVSARFPYALLVPVNQGDTERIKDATARH
ncbi:MAG: hypothetical protein JSS43_22300 [Proteobacteria bacterium]|nr:hypothetical protein [Pseudomonadota bacterium]